MQPLTNEERILVETNLYLVNKIVHYNIHIQESIQGLGYDDLYQVGCEALCHAAQTYSPDRNASFPTFTKVVVYNRLLTHCNKVVKTQAPLEYLDAPLEDDASLTLADTLPGDNHNAYSDIETCMLFNETLQRYNGVYRKGLYALHLRHQGHTNMEIADYFGTKPNHITAWISIATKKLQSENCLS